MLTVLTVFTKLTILTILTIRFQPGATKSELSLRRNQKNWKLTINSITPQQKFEQYKQSAQYKVFGLGDGGATVFALNHDSRAGL